jgi:transcriptional regulator with XRE-family HTH domain
MRIIINESGLKQKEFAKSIKVTDSYISKVIRDESGMSNRTAMAIEQLYGYSYDWIVKGKDPKMLSGRGRNLTSLQRKIIMDVEQMNESELRALLAFIETLKKSVVRPTRERKAQ